jgi:hypothetical protein
VGYDASVMHFHVLQTVHRQLRNFTGLDKSFEGKLKLLGGDFSQAILTIIRDFRISVASCIKEHRLWTKCHVLKLRRNMRPIKSEKEYSDWLQGVGHGGSGTNVTSSQTCFTNTYDSVQRL